MDIHCENCGIDFKIKEEFFRIAAHIHCPVCKYELKNRYGELNSKSKSKAVNYNGLSRIVEVYDFEREEWLEVPFEDIQHGDLFRLFDGEDRYVNSNNDSNAWVVSGSPYINTNGIEECKISKSFIEV
jgi:hypothetical protein